MTFYAYFHIRVVNGGGAVLDRIRRYRMQRVLDVVNGYNDTRIRWPCSINSAKHLSILDVKSRPDPVLHVTGQDSEAEMGQDTVHSQNSDAEVSSADELQDDTQYNTFDGGAECVTRPEESNATIFGLNFEKEITLWLNTQHFPSALLVGDVKDLRSGQVLHDLATVYIDQVAPQAITLAPTHPGPPSARISLVINMITEAMLNIKLSTGFPLPGWLSKAESRVIDDTDLVCILRLPVKFM